CGFGPHNPELHRVCIECGRRQGSGERGPAQSLHNHQNSQNVDSANTTPPRPTSS
ncbi:hypothetical protein HOY82DRAFT_629467, partial [Tuber indicum]